jgi:hypothetical protein
VILIAAISALVAYFAANAVLKDPSEESVTIEYIDPISAVIVDPDPEVFNPVAINPTVEVKIGRDPMDDDDDDECELDDEGECIDDKVDCEPGDAECAADEE